VTLVQLLADSHHPRLAACLLTHSLQVHQAAAQAEAVLAAFHSTATACSAASSSSWSRPYVAVLLDALQVHQAAAQAEAALAAFQSGVPMPNIGAAEALLPGSAGANMAAAGNAAAANHNEAAVAAGTVPAAALAAGVGPFPGPPGAVPASGPGSHAAAAMLVTEAGASSVPTPYVVVVGMITPDVLEDGEEYEEVRQR
jgi:hypothetical protein